MRAAVVIIDKDIRRIVLHALKQLTIEVLYTSSTIKVLQEKISRKDTDLLIIDDQIDSSKDSFVYQSLIPTIVISLNKPLVKKYLIETIVHYIDISAITSSDQQLTKIKVELESFLKKKIPIVQNESCIKIQPGSAIKFTLVNVFVIGSSAGGPEAQVRFWKHIERPLPVPVFIVQHMPEGITSHFVEQLKRCSPMPVQVARHGEIPRSGTIYVAPGGKQCRVIKKAANVQFELDNGTTENNCCPSIDVLITSIADVYGAGSLVMLLTGMGEDGKIGCEMIRSNNGQIIVQDKSTSLIWGIPGAVATAGLADAIMPLDDLGELIATGFGAKMG